MSVTLAYQLIFQCGGIALMGALAEKALNSIGQEGLAHFINFFTIIVLAWLGAKGLFGFLNSLSIFLY